MSEASPISLYSVMVTATSEVVADHLVMISDNQIEYVHGTPDQVEAGFTREGAKYELVAWPDVVNGVGGWKYSIHARRESND